MDVIEATRPVLLPSASELGNKSGGILAALASGALARADDHRANPVKVAALLVGPADIPAVLGFLGTEPGKVRSVSASELGNRSGGLLAELPGDRLILIRDHNVGRDAALMVAPALHEDVLLFLGVNPEALAAPGTACDQIPVIADEH